MHFNKLFIILLGILSMHAGIAQQLDKEKLNLYLQQLAVNNKMMGSVTMLRHGEIIYTGNGGYADMAASQNTDAATLYRIGSISKTITATLILKAVEEGKLSLSQTIQSFFPSIAHAQQITIRDLLNHHSGIHNFTGGNFLTWNTQPKTRQELIDTIVKGGSDFAPGTKGAYSNSNYVLLSFVLEDVYHTSYASILDKAIIHPLRLRHFQFGDKGITQKNKALPYHFEAGWEANTVTDLSIPLGAGGIVSASEDLATVINAIFQGNIISGHMLDTMKKQTDGYGMGVFEKTVLGKKAYMHDGAIDGFNSYFYFFPEDQTVYVLLSNAENYKMDAVNNVLLSAVFNLPSDIPVWSRYKVTGTALNQYTGTYSSSASPLVIDISTRNNFLLAQPRGQQVYTMEPVEEHVFSHEKTNVTLTFNPAQHELLLKQGSQTIRFTKQ